MAKSSARTWVPKPEWTRLAEDRTACILDKCFSFYRDGRFLLNLRTSCYLQGVEDAGTALGMVDERGQWMEGDGGGI